MRKQLRQQNLLKMCYTNHGGVLSQVASGLHRSNLGPCPDPTMDHIATVIQTAAGSVMPYKALERQKRFMNRRMCKPADMKIRQYVSHLVQINSEETPFMPPFNANQQLSKDKLMDIIMFGIPQS